MAEALAALPAMLSSAGSAIGPTLGTIGTSALTGAATRGLLNLTGLNSSGGGASNGPPRTSLGFSMTPQPPNTTIPTRVPAAGDISTSGFAPASGSLEILLKRLMAGGG